MKLVSVLCHYSLHLMIFYCFCIAFTLDQISADDFHKSPSQIFFETDKQEILLSNKPWQIIDLSSNGYDYGGISTKCMTYLKDFSNATSLFIDCAVTNARPLHYCEKCVSWYLSVNYMFGLITNDTSQQKHNCKEEILRADTIQLALLTYNFVKNIWETSHCDRCFNITYTNKTLKYDTNKMTESLLDKINVTLECFKDFSRVAHNDTHFNASVCDKCDKLYSEANDYYGLVEDKGMLCSDLIDSMNYTRLAWAGKYNCTIAKKDKGAIWIITAIVCLLPFLLYLALIVYDKKVTEFQETS